MFNKDLKLWVVFAPKQKKLTALFILITVMLIVTSCVQEKSVPPTETVAFIETSTPSLVPPPTDTPTPSITPTPTATATPTSVPTATPLPYRKWDFDAFYEFYRRIDFLLILGYQFHDGEKIFEEGYPNWPYRAHDSGQITASEWESRVEEIKTFLKKAYAQNDNANFYCLWALKGISLGYVNPPHEHMDFHWSQLRSALGDRSREPYCKEFDRDYDPGSVFEMGGVVFEMGILPRPTPVPQRSYGWTVEEKEYIFANYIRPMARLFDASGWGTNYVPMYSLSSTVYSSMGLEEPWPSEWLHLIPDSIACWLVANHSMFALELWEDNPYVSYKREYEARNSVRYMLADELSDYCPNLIDRVAPQYYPPPAQ